MQKARSCALDQLFHPWNLMSPPSHVQYRKSRELDRCVRLRPAKLGQLPFNYIQLLSHYRTFALTDLQRTFCFADFRG